MATKVTYTGDGNIAFCEKVGLCPKSMTRKVRLKYSQLVRAVHVLPFLCKTCFGIASAWPKNPYHKLLRINAWNTGQTHKTQTNTQCVSVSMQRYTHTHTHICTLQATVYRYTAVFTHTTPSLALHTNTNKDTHTHTHKHYKRRIFVVFTHTGGYVDTLTYAQIKKFRT